MYRFSTGTTDNPPLPGDVDKGSRFSPGTRRHGRFTPAAIFAGTALLLTLPIIFGSGFGGKGSLRSLALVKTEDKIDNSLEVEEQSIILTDITEARGDDSKKEKASIPQVLWQTAKSHNVPADVAKIMSTWSSLNPNLDQRLLDVFEVISFMMQHFNLSVVKAFQNLPLAVMRADFFRLAVMYHEGGIYADVDVSSNVPIHDWQYDDYGPIMDSCDVVIGMENNAHVSNWGFASVKEHILFQEAIELSLSRFLQGVDVSYEHFVHYTTGPGVFTDALVYLARKAGCEWDGKCCRAQEMYHSCRPLLKEKYGICYVDEATQRKWFLNHYAASNSNLQSEEWNESWKEAAQELYATTTKEKMHTEIIDNSLSLEVEEQRIIPTGISETKKQQSETVVAKVDNGGIIDAFDMEVYARNDIVSDAIRQHGYWDLGKINLFVKMVQEYRTTHEQVPISELTFVDIGSNIGFFALSMARLGVNVMAFEPMKSNTDMMERSLRLQSNIDSGLSQRVQLFKTGLGTKEQTCFIVSGINNEGDGLMKCVGELEDELGDYVVREKVVTKRLDDLVSSQGRSIVLVKMDVEGFESHVVGGGKQFLLKSKIPYIVSEFVPDWIRQHGGDPVQMLNTLYDAGYKVIAGEDIVDQHYLTREEALEMDRYSHNHIDDVIFKLVGAGASVQHEERVIPITVTEAREDDPKKEEATASVDSNDQFMIVPNICNVPEDRNKIFDKIYVKGGWGQSILKPSDFYGEAQWPPKAVRQKSASGQGSELGYTTQTSLKVIKDTIAKYKVTSMVDIPCGDANWVLDSFETDSLPYYVGLDIVRPVIEVNKQRFAHHKNKQFHFWDAVSCTLPKLKKAGTTEVVPFDLVHVRDVIQHMDVEQGIQFFCNVFKSGAKVLITTTFPGGDNPKPGGFVEGDFYQNNLSKEPFSFPVTSDSCTPTHPRVEPDDTCVYDLSEGWVQDFIANKCM